jgi:hypothetical protein
MVNGTNRLINIESKKRVKLTGPELEEYRRKKEKDRHRFGRRHINQEKSSFRILFVFSI